MQQTELIPHLFRKEFSKIVAVLSKLMGITHVEAAEDIAGETFLLAMESWPYKGVPANPEAWLYTVAKNKAKNYMKRQQLFTGKIAGEWKQENAVSEMPEIDLSEKNITDSQLQMLFAVCHPSLPAEAQIGLALRILCGFGIDEIANAFLTNKETINKRLFRAREKLRTEKVVIGFPGEEAIGERLGNVLRTLYLLFNEGYYSESDDTVMRNELCLEAMRLAFLLTENPLTDRPEVSALLSLMCFHASRFEARQKENGEIVLYDEQDESRWNHELIAKGGYYLQRASQGKQLSKYHLEAGIAWWHTQKADTKEKWENILQLYNHLLMIEYSPIAALNRTFALSKVKGNAVAIAEAEKLKLVNNPYYFSLLGELYAGIDGTKAKAHLERALSLAKTQADKSVIRKKLERF